MANIIISKLTANDNGTKTVQTQDILKQKKRTDRKCYDKYNYNHRNYQNRYISSSGDRRISFSGRIQYGQNSMHRPRYEQSSRNDLRSGNF